MADVTREEAEEMVEALECAVRGDAADWCLGGGSKSTRAEVDAARETLIAALTRPAPSPSDGEAVDSDIQLVSELAKLHADYVAAISRVVDGVGFYPHASVMAIGKQISAVLARLRGGAVPEGPRANTEEELREMMKDKRYWRDRDPAFIRAVADGYRRLYHGKDNSRAAPKPEVPR